MKFKEGGFADSFLEYQKEVERKSYNKAIDDAIAICDKEYSGLMEGQGYTRNAIMIIKTQLQQLKEEK